MIDYSAAIENALSEYLENANIVLPLKKSVQYSLMNAGKRIRPYLCLLISDMLCGHYLDALPFACAVEMIHTYSLIHDDLPAMDNDEVRRGKPSNHIAFGEGNAILAGDALLTLACSIISNQSNRKAAKAISEGALEMLNGQIMDINNLSKDDASLKKMYNGKTGGLFYSAILSGFYAAGGEAEDAEKWKEFALNFGMLFQITDDIIDMQKDKRESKFTYLTMHSLDDAYSYCNLLLENLVKSIEPYKTIQQIHCGH